MAKCITVGYNEEEVAQQLFAFRKSTSWFNENRMKLRQEYKDNYIAIRNGKVIVINPDIERIYNILKEKNIPINEVLIEFLPSDDLIWIL